MNTLARNFAARTAAAALFFTALGALAQDWPQWRGPNRDGKASGFEAPATWPKDLTQKWKVDVGAASATPALVGGKLYVFARKGDDEVLQCLDAASGQMIWSTSYGCGPATGPAGSHPGPRSSPTVADGKVVTLGVRGALQCVDAASGKVLWRKDDFHAWPRFFTSMSPLVVNGLCVAHLGGPTNGAIIAYDLKSGDEKWRWTGDSPAYASPVVMSVAGRQLIVSQTDKMIVALDAADGKQVWQAPFPPKGISSNSETPIVDGDVLIYTGVNRGTTAVKLTKENGVIVGRDLWHNDDNTPQFASPVLKDGLIFGLSQKGKFYCVNEKTGHTLWVEETGDHGGFGSIVDAGSTLLAMTPKSELIAFQPSEKEFSQVASFKVPGKPSYAYPVVAGNRIFIEDQDSVALWTLN